MTYSINIPVTVDQFKKLRANGIIVKSGVIMFEYLNEPQSNTIINIFRN